jgi:hypothetical protein
MKKGATRKELVFEQKVILGLSLPLVALLVLCSAVGLYNPGIYELSTPNWLTQTVVQDGVNLFLIAPVLIVAALYAFQGVKFAFLMWGGTVGYLVYTFLIYCFSVHFNVLFPIYCLVLGLSVFSLAWFVFTQMRSPVVTSLDSKLLLKLTAIYFIVISSGFYILWLFEIVPAAFSNKIPESLSEAGLVTNPVQVIDLSVFLPLVFITGVMAIKGRPFVAVLIPVILIFFVLMDATIGTLTLVLSRNGLGGSPVVALSMGILALVSIILLIMFVRTARGELSN